jgi:hypothetical protein
LYSGVAEMNGRSGNHLAAASPARRHFLALIAAGAGRLSALFPRNISSTDDGSGVVVIRRGPEPWENIAEYHNLYGTEDEMMTSAAPIRRYKAGRAELVESHRLATSRLVDVRDPVQIAYDWIAARAISIAA